MKINNKIYVNVHKDNTAILIFPDYNIETTAYIGKNGTTFNKKEGDGKTPLGEFDLGLIIGTNLNEEIIKKVDMEYIQINDNMYWVDDPKSKYYNQLVDVTKVNKDWNTAEHLIEYSKQYEYAIEIKSNPHNVPNKGSVILLHCKCKQYTEGCVSIQRDIMKEIIELVNSNTKIIISNKI